MSETTSRQIVKHQLLTLKNRKPSPKSSHLFEVHLGCDCNIQKFSAN